jgi:hypothetical protein
MDEATTETAKAASTIDKIQTEKMRDATVEAFEASFASSL